MSRKTGRKVALVLGGGAARGVAHIGVLKVLQSHGISFDLVVGTSIGSLVGAVYALGIPIEKFEQMALKTTWRDLADFVISKTGFLEGRNLDRVIKESIEEKDFDDLKIPLAVVATDIENGEEIVLTKGPLAKVIRASCSIPGIFIPVRIDSQLLVDGGLKSSVPTDVAKKMGADFIVAVDVGFCVKKGKVSNIFQVLFQSLQIIGNELSRFQSREADVAIKVRLGQDIDQMAFHKAKEIIASGEKAAQEAMPLLLAQMKESGVI